MKKQLLILTQVVYSLLIINGLFAQAQTEQALCNPPFVQAWKNDQILPAIQLPQSPIKQKNLKKTMIETLGINPIDYELDGTTKVFRLTAQPVETVMVDTNASLIDYLIPTANKVPHHHRSIVQKIRGWGYNGSIPGPTLEASEGDRVRIIVTNELPEPTSIHWHGIEVPNDQDGAAPETQKPIMPGEQYTYEFTLYQSGTFMYHSGFNPMKQEGWGLAGMFVVHPKNYETKIDKQIVILLQEWSILPGNIYPNLATMDFNWFTFNGHASPSIPPIKLKQGERVRLRFGNLSMNSHPIHIHGYTWTEVGTEGGPIPPSAQIKGSTINVPPGTTRDVEFVAWNPGVWRLHCHKLHHIVSAHAQVPMGVMDHGSMFTLIHVEPQTQGQWQHPSVVVQTEELL
jgi:hypothetical protein